MDLTNQKRIKISPGVFFVFCLGVQTKKFDKNGFFQNTSITSKYFKILQITSLYFAMSLNTLKKYFKILQITSINTSKYYDLSIEVFWNTLLFFKYFIYFNFRVFCCLFFFPKRVDVFNVYFCCFFFVQ